MSSGYGSRPQKGGYVDTNSRYINQPSAYNYVFDGHNDDRRYSGSGFKEWLRRKWWLVALGAIVVLIVAIVGGVLGARANAYPNYVKLGYTLTDTYAGTGFFDNFNYFATYDPAEGFVQ